MSIVPSMVLDCERLLSVKELPQLVKQRRAFLYRHYRGDLHSTLEIGALNTPTIRPGRVPDLFLDWFHTDELRARHKENPKVDQADLVLVDHVIKPSEFASQLDGVVDMVIANHVIGLRPQVHL